MAVIALASAKGAPGVTTSALALALAWPQPVLLLEADVAGSSTILAGYLQGTVRHDKGLVDLALAHRHGQLEAGIHDVSISLPDSQARLVPGLTSPAQAPALRPVWEHIAAVLAAMERSGVDVIVDAGRLGTAHGPVPLLREADLTLITTRTTLPAVAATRAGVLALLDGTNGHGGRTDAAALLLVGEGRPYSGREITDSVRIPVAATLAWDPVAAEVFSLGAAPSRRFNSTPLVRSVHQATTTIRQAIAARRDRLAPHTPGRA